MSKIFQEVSRVKIRANSPVNLVHCSLFVIIYMSFKLFASCNLNSQTLMLLRMKVNDTFLGRIMIFTHLHSFSEVIIGKEQLQQDLLCNMLQYCT